MRRLEVFALAAFVPTTGFSAPPANDGFTSDDAAVGKVTFQAVATIIGARDALPSDNTAIASPTNVTP